MLLNGFRDSMLIQTCQLVEDYLGDRFYVNFKLLLRLYLQEKDRRFTYCPLYNTATVLPIHPETVKKQDLMDSKELWRTEKGFIFPGKKTSLVSNIHPKKPDSARVDELEKVPG